MPNLTAGIGFVGLMMNQAGANVLIYNDGTVLISHGGVELGQGLHTKCVMVSGLPRLCGQPFVCALHMPCEHSVSS